MHHTPARTALPRSQENRDLVGMRRNTAPEIPNAADSGQFSSVDSPYSQTAGNIDKQLANLHLNTPTTITGRQVQMDGEQKAREAYENTAEHRAQEGLFNWTAGLMEYTGSGAATAAIGAQIEAGNPATLAYVQHLRNFKNGMNLV